MDERNDYNSIPMQPKTPMELALARIELMKEISPDSIHWQMFKDNYIYLEKLMIIDKQIELYNQLNTLGLLLPNSIGFELEELKKSL
jgi:hypothetical protein